MNKKWWQDKICYQIYPKSFLDTNGDGIGDLRGVIEKLDYLKGLGIDMVWLSPIYKSPLADQGYDISDYYDIDPRFGTLDDLKDLIAGLHQRDMKLIMDLVVNHCSDEHECFKKACEDPDGKYGRYFYIVDKPTDGSLPTNWRSYFGGSVWQELPGHPDKMYLHVFHRKQPDLNWENPKLRNDIYKMINWWLDLGVDGFRLDAIINIKKALPMKNYPPDRDDGLSTVINMLKDANGIGEFLGEMRERTFKPHDAFTVGEVFNEKESEIPDFIGKNGYFSSMFDFSAEIFGRSPNGDYDNKPITPDDYKACIFNAQRETAGIGFLSNIIENHDEPRGVSRYIPEGDCNIHSKKMLAALNVLLKGIPFIFQGQELGMENQKFRSINEIDDIGTKDSYQVALDAGLTPEEAFKAVTRYSRDNARTPMQWADAPHAGFTDGTPWLRENDNYHEINAAAELQDSDSVLSWYKQLIALRKNDKYSDVLVYGDLIPYLEDQHDIFAYRRVLPADGREILVIADYQRDPQTAALPEGDYRVLMDNYDSVGHDKNQQLSGEIRLKGYQVLVLEKLIITD